MPQLEYAPTDLEQPLDPAVLASVLEARPVRFRLRPIMRQGTASSVAETWCHYDSLEAARKAAKPMYHDDRVLRVFVVTDELPPQFVEWIER